VIKALLLIIHCSRSGPAPPPPPPLRASRERIQYSTLVTLAQILSHCIVQSLLRLWKELLEIIRGIGVPVTERWSQLQQKWFDLNMRRASHYVAGILTMLKQFLDLPHSMSLQDSARTDIAEVRPTHLQPSQNTRLAVYSSLRNQGCPPPPIDWLPNNIPPLNSHSVVRILVHPCNFSFHEA
jgi:hypothetical protein